MRVGPRVAVGRLPAAPGVYRFRDENGRILYIGRATSLRHRVDSYWGKLGDRRHLARMVPRIAQVEAVVCDSVHEAAWLERNLLERRKPYWNRARGGAEVPVYIRLDRPPAGLRLVHEHEVPAGQNVPAAPGIAAGDDVAAGPDAWSGGPDGAVVRHFGPYLGGSKVRLAVSALHRVLPVAYAAVGLTGSERDMARARGIGPGDRNVLVRTAVAVLDRDPHALAALVAELARRRDAAAGALAFELAARMQEEIEAIEWVAAEQKVTAPLPYDVDVCAFADGLLVRFEVRQGRLRTWTQRASTEAAAARAVEATPPAWRSFAERNARLAAHLLGSAPETREPTSLG